MWCRLGVTIDMKLDEGEKPSDFIERALREGKMRIDGETYSPEGIGLMNDFYPEGFTLAIQKGE